ncbi:unnamed protein product [Rotaria magnacalcarata]|uniref:Uncharacterized protein n=1 Tax=Rotaria magnacalcarata TaxID=392030 RepID=A0A815SY96_9BILA|nr:unnamed protein product [Rotaria magnacalcarata]CAF1541741.1 unnamed protein product [Rotaria magnacalcarata]CAF4535640.1 unnamed protein product [Rotaria magnacalcarata]CAF5046423.1 unnamed protein product [Rotaria magnacalcarata]
MTAFTFAHAVYDCITAIYGFRQDWAREQPLCAFTGYVLVISAAGTHHAHLVEALSRLFFTVFFKRKFLQTYRVHWCLIIGNWLFTTLAPILPFSTNMVIHMKKNHVFVIRQQNNSPLQCTL